MNIRSITSFIHGRLLRGYQTNISSFQYYIGEKSDNEKNNKNSWLTKKNLTNGHSRKTPGMARKKYLDQRK